MAFQFNPNDPRYQRDKQRAASVASMRGETPGLAAQRQVSAAHADRQLGTHLAFQELGLQKKLADQKYLMDKSRLKMADKERGLQKDKLSFNKRLFKDEMSDRRSNLRWTVGLGLGTAGWSYLEGRRRAKEMDEERGERQKFWDLMNKKDKELEEYRNKSRRKLKLTGEY